MANKRPFEVNLNVQEDVDIAGLSLDDNSEVKYT